MPAGKAIFIVGTTATGKSDWAVEAAARNQGVIINCDSIQMYAGLRIGSAQPSFEQLNRVPHHLYEFVHPPKEMTAGNYRRAHLEQLGRLDQPVFVVGGTGFYFQALEKGMFAAPAASPVLQKQIEAQLEKDGEASLWQELFERDPATAKKIHKNDHYRLVRAIEVIRREGRPLSEIKQQFADSQEKYPWPYKKFGVQWSRDELNARVRIRAKKMMDDGLIEETKSFLDQGLASWAPMSSVGYREAVVFLRENKTKEWLLEEIVGSTMRLAKKQKTWFQRDPEIQWFHGRDDLAKFLAEVDAYLHSP